MLAMGKRSCHLSLQIPQRQGPQIGRVRIKRFPAHGAGVNRQHGHPAGAAGQGDDLAAKVCVGVALVDHASPPQSLRLELGAQGVQAAQNALDVLEGLFVLRVGPFGAMGVHIAQIQIVLTQLGGVQGQQDHGF